MKISKNAWWTLGFVLLVVLVFGMLTIIGQESGAQQATAHQPGGALSPAASPAAQAEKKLRVSVYGAVQHEGEMLLPAHATVRDALDQARVLRQADIDELFHQQERRVFDGMRIVVPFRAIEAGQTVCVNEPDVGRFMLLEGMTRPLAEKVVAYLLDGKRFASLQEFQDFCGLSQQKYDKIKGYLTL